MTFSRTFTLAGFLLALTASPKAIAQVELGNVTEKHVMIPMRDGTRLSAYLYFPAGKGPWPVLYEQRYADLRGVETRKTNARLAAAGYVVAAQNFRGTHLSEGTWVGYRALGWGEKKDGFDSVEWLAKQPRSMLGHQVTQPTAPIPWPEDLNTFYSRFMVPAVAPPIAPER